jgi:hypothetical protein
LAFVLDGLLGWGEDNLQRHRTLVERRDGG